MHRKGVGERTMETIYSNTIELLVDGRKEIIKVNTEGEPMDLKSCRKLIIDHRYSRKESILRKRADEESLHEKYAIEVDRNDIADLSRQDLLQRKRNDTENLSKTDSKKSNRNSVADAESMQRIIVGIKDDGEKVNSTLETDRSGIVDQSPKVPVQVERDTMKVENENYTEESDKNKIADHSKASIERIRVEIENAGEKDNLEPDNNEIEEVGRKETVNGDSCTVEIEYALRKETSDTSIKDGATEKGREGNAGEENREIIYGVEKARVQIDLKETSGRIEKEIIDESGKNKKEIMDGRKNGAVDKNVKTTASESTKVPAVESIREKMVESVYLEEASEASQMENEIDEGNSKSISGIAQKEIPNPANKVTAKSDKGEVVRPSKAEITHDNIECRGDPTKRKSYFSSFKLEL